MEAKNEGNSCENLIKDSINLEFYKVLFDPVRTEILVYLVSYGKKNIKEIAENFSQDRSVISRHLDLMYRYQIVKKIKITRNVYYDANEEYVIGEFANTLENMKALLNRRKGRP